ncbi:hypothetical protein ACVIU4_005568 [Bradyrhizobium barranii subsp. barranii]|nr:hypothetical protein [Bradyrhizobium japonicum]MCP1957763.1 hypothetical protein [Bradyrhizobium japonicum]
MPEGRIGNRGVAKRDSWPSAHRIVSTSFCRVSERAASSDDVDPTLPRQRRAGRAQALRVRDRDARQQLELELVRRGQFGGRQQPVLHHVQNAVGDIDAAVIADHGVAEIDQLRIPRQRPLDEVGDHRRVARRAEIAGDEHRGLVDEVALLDAFQEIGDELGLQHPPAQRRIARMVRQQRRRHCRDVHALGLHGIGGRAVADMAVDHLALNGDDEHAEVRKIKC